MENANHDWAYLERFRLENEGLKLHLDENRIVFIGDSIIAGWNEHSFFKENSHYINRGINGQTTTQILHRFQSDVLDLKPKCVVVLVGTNDVAENLGPITLKEIEKNFLTIIAICEKNGLKLIFCSLLPVKQYYWNKRINPFEKIVQLNQFLCQQSNNSSVLYCDFYTIMTVDKAMDAKLTDDGVHPNKNGYTLMSSILSDNLSDFL